jgi:hypothetical protein
MHRFRTEPGDHRFFSAMSIVAVAVVVTGFGRTYGAKVIAGAPPVPAIVHVHAAIFTLWLALFVAQALLVLRGRTDLHRRLGVAGVVLAWLMLVVGVATSVAVARLGHRGVPGVEFADAAGFLLLNLGAVCVFTALAVAGWYFRRSPQTHKRLMLMATVGGLMPPGIARLPLVAGHAPAIAAVAVAFFLVGPVYDLLTRRRIHVAYLWGLLLTFAIIPPIVGAVSATGAWHRVAVWLMG